MTVNSRNVVCDEIDDGFTDIVILIFFIQRLNLENNSLSKTLLTVIEIKRILILTSLPLDDTDKAGATYIYPSDNIVAQQ